MFGAFQAKSQRNKALSATFFNPPECKTAALCGRGTTFDELSELLLVFHDLLAANIQRIDTVALIDIIAEMRNAIAG